MIKDKLTEAVEIGLKSIENGDDHIPLNMRGELEVVVKDRDGNIVSYERGHNQVTDLAKMAIIHLLAGEVGVIDSGIYSIPETSGTTFQRTYKLSDTAPDTGAEIFSSFIPGNHSQSENKDGQLVSGEQYFYTGLNYVNVNAGINKLSQVQALDISNSAIKFNFPTKMLFGTGMEAYDDNSMTEEYSDEMGSGVMSPTAILKLNGVSNASTSPDWFWEGCDSETDEVVGSANTKLSNWYSNSKFRSRTLQPSSPDALITPPDSTTTSIRGAIKNCFITGTTQEDISKYNATNKMAKAQWRGCGYPCFIYAKRSTSKFYEPGEGNHETNYQMNPALGSVPYETEITYTVDMPAQPVNSTDVTSFYPYNGWILKQAGLFSDSRFRLRSMDNVQGSQYAEATLLSKTNGSQSDDVKSYRDSVGGQLLFTRNLSSPILKTADNEITFYWHIFITI